MISIEDYKLFENNQSTIKETSKDTHSGQEAYLSNSLFPVVNFDKVKEEYSKNLLVVEFPKSLDALATINGAEDFFIEFKAGRINSKKEYSIRGKVLNSLIIFMDIINKTAEYTRANLSLILVYDDVQNPINEILNNSVQPSASRTKISKTLIEEKAKGRYRQFGLDIFEKLYFKNVYTYSVDEFEKKFVKVYCNDTESVNAETNSL